MFAHGDAIRVTARPARKRWTSRVDAAEQSRGHHATKASSSTRFAFVSAGPSSVADAMGAAIAVAPAKGRQPSAGNANLATKTSKRSTSVSKRVDDGSSAGSTHANNSATKGLADLASRPSSRTSVALAAGQCWSHHSPVAPWLLRAGIIARGPDLADTRPYRISAIWTTQTAHFAPSWWRSPASVARGSSRTSLAGSKK